MSSKDKAIAYLKDGGSKCPHCGGMLEGGSMNFEGGEICQRISCSDCQELWQDVYKLCAVVTMDGELIASIPVAEEQV